MEKDLISGSLKEEKMKFATCLNCMDGRAQLPVIYWIKEFYNVDYVDMITEAGMDGILSGNPDIDMNNLYNKIEISVSGHKSGTIFLVGHHDCGGNPVDDDTHKRQITSAVENLSKYGFPVTLIGLWLSAEWIVEEITKK